MPEQEEKIFRAYLLSVLRKYRHDPNLFPELKNRGPYFVINEGAEFNIVDDIIERFNQEGNERIQHDCPH